MFPSFGRGKITVLILVLIKLVSLDLNTYHFRRIRNQSPHSETKTFQFDVSNKN